MDDVLMIGILVLFAGATLGLITLAERLMVEEKEK